MNLEQKYNYITENVNGIGVPTNIDDNLIRSDRFRLCYCQVLDCFDTLDCLNFNF